MLPIIRRVVPIVSAVCALFVGTSVDAAAQAPGHYRLTPAASAQVGCLDLCRCPIREEPSFEGTFELVADGSDPTGTRFRVEQVDWRIGGEQPVELRGAGTLLVETSGGERVQTIELELSANGDVPTRFLATDLFTGESTGDTVVAEALRPAERVCRGQVLAVRAERVEDATPPQSALPAGFELERVSWLGEVDEGQHITVRNPFGDVRARFGGYAGQVELLANVQHFSDEGARLEVDTAVVPTGLVVTVGYRTSTGALALVRDAAEKKRVDLVIYVPQDVPLSVMTDAGLIDVRGLRSDVRGRSAGGAIRARGVDGTLDLATSTGDLVTLLETWYTARHHRLVTEHGPLSVVFGGEINAAIRASTSGLISTDFSMELDYQADRRPVRQGEVFEGKGSSSVMVRSTDGRVRLTRKPLAREARVQPPTEPGP